jgi:hypothetical protein
MSTRIRYDDRGVVLTSRRRFITASGKEVAVEIDKETNSFKIITTQSDPTEVLASGDRVSVNLSVTKIHAKNALISLGVLFEDEKRDRGASVGLEQTTIRG